MQQVKVRLVDPRGSFLDEGVVIAGKQVKVFKLTEKVQRGLRGGILEKVADVPAPEKKAKSDK